MKWRGLVSLPTAAVVLAVVCFVCGPVRSERPAVVWMASGHSGPVNSVAFSPDGRLIASASSDKSIKLWRATRRVLVRTLRGHKDEVTSVAFSPDGSLLASASWDGTIKLWQVSDGALLRTFAGHRWGVSSVSFSPDGSVIASGSWDKTVRLWRVGDGSAVLTLTGHTDVVVPVAFSPDGSVLASGSWDKTIRLWRVGDGSLIRTLTGHDGAVNSLAFSPDGRMLASASSDWTVKLWRLGDGSLVRTLTGHRGWVSSVCFLPDGVRVASGSSDWTIKLWRVSDGSLEVTYDEDTPWVLCVDFSPDGNLLAYGRQDGTVVVARKLSSVAPKVQAYGPQIPPISGPSGQVRWYLTGQVHAHWMSEYPPIGSDYTPSELARRYAALGYEFLASTEHYPDPKWPGRFASGMFQKTVDVNNLIYIGDSLEDTAKHSHILAIGFGYHPTRVDIPNPQLDISVIGAGPHTTEWLTKRLRNIKNAGGLAVIAHPNAGSYRWSENEILSAYPFFDAVEVFNSMLVYWTDFLEAVATAAGTMVGGVAGLVVTESAAQFLSRKAFNGWALDTWDRLLTRLAPVWGTCGDDFTPPEGVMDRGCITAVVDLPEGVEPTRNEVLSALRSGSFYASYGKGASKAPQIKEWWHDEQEGRVKLAVSSPEGLKVRFIADWGSTGWEPFPPTGLAFFDIKGKQWVRAEVRDAYGRVSLTQPFTFNKELRSAKTLPPVTGSTLKQEDLPMSFELGDAVVLFPTRPAGFEDARGELVGTDERPRRCPPLGYMSDCYRFEPEAEELPVGTTLTIKYEPDRIGLCPERRMAIYWYDPEADEWTRLQSEVDVNAGTVRAVVARLGLFALSGEILGEDVTPPTIRIASPAPRTRVLEPVEVLAEAGDDNGVGVVRFMLNGSIVEYDINGSDGWSAVLDPSEHAPGRYTLTVEAEDASGNTAQASMDVVLGPLIRGDVDGNGKVTTADAVVALRTAVGLVRPGPEQLEAGDLDGDGRVSVAEAVRILRAAVGIEVL